MEVLAKRKRKWGRVRLRIKSLRSGSTVETSSLLNTEFETDKRRSYCL